MAQLITHLPHPPASSRQTSAPLTASLFISNGGALARPHTHAPRLPGADSAFNYHTNNFLHIMFTDLCGRLRNGFLNNYNPDCFYYLLPTVRLPLPPQLTFLINTLIAYTRAKRHGGAPSGREEGNCPDTTTKGRGRGTSYYFKGDVTSQGSARWPVSALEGKPGP